MLLALDVLVRNEFVVYDVSPQLGEIFPYIKVQQPTKQLPTVVMKMISWPFYVPFLVGGTCIGLDVNQIRKSKQFKKEVEETIESKIESEVV
jgi:hypothetical protein